MRCDPAEALREAPAAVPPPEPAAAEALVGMSYFRKYVQNISENTKIQNLTNGPGKLTQALDITLQENSHDLTKYSSLYIANGIKIKKMVTPLTFMLQTLIIYGLVK